MFYKVIQDGMILDAWESPDFVKYRASKQRFLLIEKTEEDDGFLQADGVILPGGADTWLLDSSGVIIEGKEAVKLEPITETEFEELVKQLESEGGGIKIPEPEPIPEPDPEPETTPEQETETEQEPIQEQPEPETVMTRAEMQKAIKELQGQLDAEKERNTMLEECLMEMSEVVYA